MGQPCPNENELERFLVEVMPESESNRVQEHLADCERCSSWIADARADEAILGDVLRVLHSDAAAISGSADASADTVRLGNPEPDSVKGLSPLEFDTSEYAVDPLIGQRVGGYEIVRAIASGGMGTVYEAVQKQPRRTVALKVIKAGVVSSSALKRFKQEAEVLGKLHHVGIAQVYEAGVDRVSGAPVPFFAMEYIPEARSITEYVTEQQLSARQRLELFSHVCDAVDHGHSRGVVHRDIKPRNVLVDRDGQVKIIDFGVARTTDADLAVTTVQTGVGQLVGTLQYMSPEQVEADPANIDARSDVYALGVLLYELLTGHCPYDLTRKAVHEAIRVIREDSPPKLSTINARLKGDVETIAGKCLEKEKWRRYTSAGAVADDIRRFLRDEPIRARRPTLFYEVGKFARRHRVLVSAVGIVMVALSVATGVSVVSLAKARSELAAAHVQEGVRLQNDKEYARAEEAFREALKLESDNFRALGNLGILYKDMYTTNPFGAGDKRLLRESVSFLEQAVFEARRAGAESARLAAIWNALAVSRYMLGELKDAEAACDNALALNPEYYWAASNRARILSLQGRMDEALVGAREACEFAGDERGAVGPWYTFATLQLFMGDEGAAESVEKALDFDKTKDAPWLIRAKTRLTIQGHIDVEGALLDAMNADVFADERDPRVKQVLAEALLRNGRWSEARAAAAEAMRLGGPVAPNALMSAITASNEGFIDSAKSYLETAEANYPERMASPGVLQPSVYRGILWFDSSDEWVALRDEARKSVYGAE